MPPCYVNGTVWPSSADVPFRIYSLTHLLLTGKWRCIQFYVDRVNLVIYCGVNFAH